MTVPLARATVGCTVANGEVPTGTVAMSYLLGVLDFARQSGADTSSLQEAFDVSTDVVEHDATQRLPLAVLQRCFVECAALLDDPAFALRFGVGVPCANLTLASPLAAAVPTSGSGGASEARTLRDALEGLNRYSPLSLHFGADAPAARYRFVQDDHGVWLEDLRPDDAGRWHWPQLTESTFARFATGIRRRGGDTVVRALEVTHAVPATAAHRDAYVAVFRAPVTFGARRNALCLDPTFLDAPLEPLPPPMQAVLAAHADAALQRVLEDGAWRRRVEDALLDAMRPRQGGRRPRSTLGPVCRQLAVSRQTLFRRLRDEGTTFVDVQDTVRRRLADELLCNERLPVAIVSDRLGYSEPGAFSRAYKRWTGRRPSDVTRSR
jgi:AraC-like DNA-binding protein